MNLSNSAVDLIVAYIFVKLIVQVELAYYDHGGILQYVIRNLSKH